MKHTSNSSPWILGVSLFLGLVALGSLLGNAIIQFKKYERTVTVKGLAEQEYPADLASWHITCSDAYNNVSALYKSLETKAKKVETFLIAQGVEHSEITIAAPEVFDKATRRYDEYDPQKEKRYTGNQTITVYSPRIDVVRKAIAEIGQFVAREDIVVDSYASYSFTRLNEVKPQMIEEATKNARSSASKFAADSQSKLGKIKTAYQGQFSINARDENSPHIKKVRVVSTVVYYLFD